MLKKTVITFFAIWISFSVHAGLKRAGDKSFQSACINAWMQKTDDAKMGYRNFSQKYCACVTEQPLDNETALQKAVQLCVSRTLLQDTMNSLESDLSLGNVKGIDITGYCQDRWNLIYSNQTDADKKQIMAYCECTKSKLMKLIRLSNNMTDKQYSEKVDEVAAVCAGNAPTIKQQHLLF